MMNTKIKKNMKIHLRMFGLNFSTTTPREPERNFLAYKPPSPTWLRSRILFIVTISSSKTKGVW